MTESMVERVFVAKVESIPLVAEFVTEQAEQAGLTAKRLMQLALVIEEAVINICNYAYEVPPGEVTVRIHTGAGRFVMEFEDGGVPFDPLTVAEPDIKLSLEEREAGGLGIFLIRRMTDEVHYRRVNGRNILSVAINTP